MVNILITIDRIYLCGNIRFTAITALSDSLHSFKQLMIVSTSGFFLVSCSTLLRIALTEVFRNLKRE